MSNQYMQSDEHSYVFLVIHLCESWVNQLILQNFNFWNWNQKVTRSFKIQVHRFNQVGNQLIIASNGSSQPCQQQFSNFKLLQNINKNYLRMKQANSRRGAKYLHVQLVFDRRFIQHECELLFPSWISTLLQLLYYQLNMFNVQKWIHQESLILI